MGEAQAEGKVDLGWTPAEGKGKSGSEKSPERNNNGPWSLNEIRAMTALKEIQAGKACLDSVANAAKMPAEFGKNLITDPADTISAIPKGIYGLFSRIGTSVQGSLGSSLVLAGPPST